MVTDLEHPALLNRKYCRKDCMHAHTYTHTHAHIHYVLLLLDYLQHQSQSRYMVACCMAKKASTPHCGDIDKNKKKHDLHGSLCSPPNLQIKFCKCTPHSTLHILCQFLSKIASCVHMQNLANFLCFFIVSAPRFFFICTNPL